MGAGVGEYIQFRVFVFLAEVFMEDVVESGLASDVQVNSTYTSVIECETDSNLSLVVVRLRPRMRDRHGA